MCLDNMERGTLVNALRVIGTEALYGINLPPILKFRMNQIHVLFGAPAVSPMQYIHLSLIQISKWQMTNKQQ